MKKVILSLLTVVVSIVSFSQTRMLPEQVEGDFTFNYLYKCQYENNQNLMAFAYYVGNQSGYGVDNIAQLKGAMTQQGFREALFAKFAEQSNYDPDALSLNLVHIGMKASNANTLSHYILNKYHRVVSNETTKSRSRENTIGTHESAPLIKVDDAQFIGGTYALNKYLNSNIHYPDSAANNLVEGVITVHFVIDTTGTVTNVEIVGGNDLGYGLPEEAVRVISNMPKWKPAMAGGKLIKYPTGVPIHFQLPGEEQISPIVKNKPKAIFHSVDSTTDSIEHSSVWFSGTKKFCDGLGGWYYKVTITGNEITLQLYADKRNKRQKDKNKPVEIINGIIQDGKIVTKAPPEYKTNRFKFEDGVLYEVNNEGGLSDYQECKN